MDHSPVPFASENSGTARFIGTGDASISNCSDSSASSSSNANNFGTGACATANLDLKAIKLANAKARAEIPHSELIKMLYYMEGELQARDVVIAALRNERVKHYISQLRSKRVAPNDPYAAIFRDKTAMAGNLISRESSSQAAQAELEVRQIIEQQMEQQYQMVGKQRATHVRMVSILTESLENNQRMLQELEEEKRKHEHDTAQGDDITYGLEMERTKLRQELETERQQVKKLEKDLKKMQETLEFERNREKQIVLLLIAERKKILMKYIEEGKRSEDLAQILAEEKQRSDAIAEGLEEESKKSLRMEEDIETQAVAFEVERKSLRKNLTKAEQRIQELEQELSQMRVEVDLLKKQQQQQQQMSTVGLNLGPKNRLLSDDAAICCGTPIVNIAKVVQPTATVSSVPVSGPTTGIARSIAPGQNLRNAGVSIAPVGIVGGAAQPAAVMALSLAQPAIDASKSCTIAANTAAVAGAAAATTTIASAAPATTKMQPTATIQRAPGSKYAALAAAAAQASNTQDQPPHAVPIAVPPVTVPPAGARGIPPPIPPNKPIVPPKREPSLSRIGSMSGAAAVNAASAGVATVAVAAIPVTAATAAAAAAAATTTAAVANASIK